MLQHFYQYVKTKRLSAEGNLFVLTRCINRETIMRWQIRVTRSNKLPRVMHNVASAYCHRAPE
ncbi:hypothetical protein CZ787_09140 [Halomonas citrativorans]|uniref:Uncharacterized protein n=1 Tax=Halomonas citrativorans TaxID=2742612 RepID=A0A1R4HZB9_9GAMM|nr:hypothetical protein CZ787_09140 [Halomonas citrativorans]